MPRLLAANNAESTLASGIASGATSLTVASGEGARFPSPGAGEAFRITINDEIIEVGSRSGDTFSSLLRGREGTTAAAHSQGDVVQNRFTAGAHMELADDADLTSHTGNTNNPHSVDKTDVGLGNVDNVKQAPKYLSINEQTGTSYTLVITDDGKLIDCNNANPFTLTVPANSSVGFPTGTQILVRQKGAGQVTITPASGVTLQSADSENKTRVQHSVAGLVKVATDTWVLFGDVTV